MPEDESLCLLLVSFYTVDLAVALRPSNTGISAKSRCRSSYMCWEWARRFSEAVGMDGGHSRVVPFRDNPDDERKGSRADAGWTGAKPPAQRQSFGEQWGIWLMTAFVLPAGYFVYASGFLNSSIMYKAQICKSINVWLILAGSLHFLMYGLAAILHVIDCKSDIYMGYFFFNLVWLLYGLSLISFEVYRVEAKEGGCSQQVTILQAWAGVFGAICVAMMSSALYRRKSRMC
eukprot:g73446.t1